MPPCTLFHLTVGYILPLVLLKYLRLLQDLQVAVSVLLPGEEVHPGGRTVDWTRGIKQRLREVGGGESERYFPCQLCSVC